MSHIIDPTAPRPNGHARILEPGQSLPSWPVSRLEVGDVSLILNVMGGMKPSEEVARVVMPLLEKTC